MKAGGSDFDYWDKVHDALEAYRKAVDATFTGKTVEWSASKLGASSGLFGKMLTKMQASKAAASKQQAAHIPPPPHLTLPPSLLA